MRRSLARCLLAGSRVFDSRGIGGAGVGVVSKATLVRRLRESSSLMNFAHNSPASALKNSRARSLLV